MLKPPKGHVFSRFEAWLDLCCIAAGIDRPDQELKRGQLVASQRYLARRWNWSLTKVNRFLRLLVKAGMIDKSDAVHKSYGNTQTERKAERITICNYETYNSRCERKAERTSGTKRKKGFLEGKKEKECKNPPTPLLRGECGSNFDVFWSEYPDIQTNARNPKRALKVWQGLTPEEATRKLERLRDWKRSEEWKKEEGRFVPTPENFLKKRSRYDHLEPTIKKTAAEYSKEIRERHERRKAAAE